MNVGSYIKAIISIVIVTIPFFVVPLTQASEDSTLIGTTTGLFANFYPYQRKSFMANSLMWQFYMNGTHWGWKTNTSSVPTWSNFNVIGGCDDGREFSVWHNGTHVAYAYSNISLASNYLKYRLGVTQNDGSINWVASEQDVHTVGGMILKYPSICLDSEGFPFIAYMQWIGAVYSWSYVINSDWNNGSWHTDTQHQIYATWNSRYYPSVVPLTDKKVYCVYGYSILAGKLWNGTVWGTEEIIGQKIIANKMFHSETVNGDIVHISFTATHTAIPSPIYKIYYDYRNSSGLWQETDEVVKELGSTEYVAPTISIDQTNDNVYVFYGNLTSDHIYYKIRSAGSWGTEVDWIDESTDRLSYATRLVSFYKSYDGIIGLTYMTNTTSPYKLRYASLSTAPTKQWYDVSSWTFDLATRQWAYIANWLFDLSSPFTFPIGPILLRVRVLVTLNGQPMDKINITITGGPSNLTFWKMTDSFGETKVQLKAGTYQFTIRHDSYLVEHNISIVKHCMIHFELNSTEYRMVRDWTTEIIEIVSGASCFIALLAVYVYHEQRTISKQWKKIKSLKGKPKKEIKKKLKGKR